MKMNKLIMIGVLALAVVAIAGIADAKSVDVSIDVNTIQTNGNYIGVPTLLVNNPGQYGYNYTFNPDGSYTVSGTVTNNDNSTDVTVSIEAKSSTQDKLIHVNIPAAVDHYYVSNVLGDKQTLAYSYTSPSTVDFSITLRALSDSDLHVYFDGSEEELDISGADYVNAPEGAHTVDEGPMSNMVVVLNNGIVNSSASVLYTLNQSSDDYKALYTNGKFDFKSSPFYSFV